MKKKWIIVATIILILAGLYAVEISKIEYSGNYDIANLDDLYVDDVARNWEPFYRVRATIIDGQSARFSIPKKLLENQDKEIELTGAAVFYSPGCSREGDQITVSYFFLLPTLGLAEACVIQPDIKMRYTIRINLKNNWIIHRDDMIHMRVTVKGRFRIDTSKPFESVFFLDDAVARIITEEETNL